MSAQGQHITEDQLETLLIEGTASPECQTHLQQCLPCRDAVQKERLAFTAAIDGFNSASLAWSASHVQPARHSPVPSRPVLSRFTPAVLAFAMVTAVALTSPFWHHEHSEAPAGTAAVPGPGQDTASEIAADNALLQSVQVALTENEPSPLDEFKLSRQSGPAVKRTSEMRTR